MARKEVLTFDFGASSGRAMVSHLEKGKLLIHEIYRFPNNPIKENKTLVWDFDSLIKNFEKGIDKALKCHNICAVGCNTWGVDFGLLDNNGLLISPPVHYRDIRTVGIPEEIFSIIPREELFLRTGVQPYQYNTIFQLYYLATRHPTLLNKTNKFLMMANLFAYNITGEFEIEESLASTTGLMNIHCSDWDYDLIDALQIPYHIFPKIVRAGTSHSVLKSCQQNLKYINIATHDTASAVMVCDKDSTFISCGTWSLLGKKTPLPILSKLALDTGYSNEVGYKGEHLFLKNLTGLWLIQGLAGEWGMAFQDIMDLASSISDPQAYIDTQHDALFSPISMNDTIDELLGYEETNKAKKARIVYESLAKKIAEEITNLDAISSKQTQSIEVVGGGAKASLLIELIEKWTHLPVKLGPVEASAVGGALAKLSGLGEVDLNLVKTSDLV